MYKIITQFFKLLTPSQRKRFYVLQILVVLMAFTDVLGVASIIPFMALVGDMSILNQDTIISKVYKSSGIISETHFVFFLGMAVLFMLFISALISIFTIWRLSMFAVKVGAEISDRLYMHYLNRDWLFHVSGSSAQLTKKIVSETGRVTGGIISPIMQMNARIVLSLFMSITIFLYDPKVAIVGILIFAFAYFILYRFVRTRLLLNGKMLSDVHEERFSLMNEGFGGIKDLLLSGLSNYFVRRFNQTGLKLAYSQGTNATLAQVPRYFLELVAFGSLIILVLYLIISHNGNLGMILPILSVYALATFKLLPSFQLIYASIARIKGNISAFESIRQDLIDSNSKEIKKKETTNEKQYLYPKNEISLKNITFSYPGKSEPTIKELNIFIKAKSVIGIVGISGSGKSTIIDILLGLITPQIGQIKVDNIILTNENLRSWQNSIGFVSQNIFLSENTIAQNIAFGVSKDEINIDKVCEVIKYAQLNDVVDKLDSGIHTKIGERGLKLSGGQRQRIGIARALYNKSEVLIFDEATSSLDGLTEKSIMNDIYNFGGKKTVIIIAHRLKTVEKCDNIFLIENGRLVDNGTYSELIKKNANFRNMSNHA